MKKSSPVIFVFVSLAVTDAAATTLTTRTLSLLPSNIIEPRTSAYRNLGVEASTDLKYNYDAKESELMRPTDWTCLLNKQCSKDLPTATQNTPLKIEARGVDGYDEGDTVDGPLSGGKIRFSMRVFAGTMSELDKDKMLKRFNETDVNDHTTTSIRYEDEYGYTEEAQGTSGIVDSDDHLIEGMLLSKDATLKRYAKNYVYQLPVKFPCWVRWVYIKIFGIKLRFPRFGWGRRCCGKKTGGGSYFSNSTGCYAGSGPFYSQAQCKRVCGPFSTTPPPPPNVNSNCTFGDNTTWAHGHTETNCAGTSCTCNNGTVTCGGCRTRYEIHDIHGTGRPDSFTAFEKKVTDSLIWVSKGCKKGGADTCAGWMDIALQNHLTYGGVAHGNSRFFPWHRAYLKTLEEKMQGYHPCVTMPYWDWTQDQVKPNGDFQWTEKMAGTAPTPTPTGQQGLWGNINGNSNTLMGAFKSVDWIIPASFPVHARTQSMNPGGSLPSTATVASYLARVSFGTSPSLKAFEGPHGSPHVMIGGNMGNGRSPADPIFWLHHAGVDKLWWDWQALHVSTDYDADPTIVMPPFTRAPQDVFDSQNDLGVCYAPVGSPVPSTFSSSSSSSSGTTAAAAASASSSRRSSSTTTQMQSLVAAAGNNMNALTAAMTDASKIGKCETIQPSPCGSGSEKVDKCFNCLLDDVSKSPTSNSSVCADSWSNNMMLDPEAVAREACRVKEFEASNPTPTQILSTNPVPVWPCLQPPTSKTCAGDSRTSWSSTTCSCRPDTRKIVQLASFNTMTPKQCLDYKFMWKVSTCRQRTCTKTA